MKKLTTLLFTISTLLAVGQNFEPVNSNTVKFFQSNLYADSTYGLSFDTTFLSGSDSLFIPYKKVGELIQSDTCTFWGSDSCRVQNRPIWIGSEVITNNQGKYRFMTNTEDTLTFNFSIQQGDSTLFYYDDDQLFYLVNEGKDTATILSVSDSVETFRIAHVDYDGNQIPSAIQDESVRIGKALGMIDFIRIDRFPQELEHVTMIGNKYPRAGRINITAGALHDHQPGDVIQYEDYHYLDPGPPWDNYSIYIRHTYLERSDTPDSIIYKVARFSFNIDSASGTHDTIFQRFKRNDVVFSAPYDKLEDVGGWLMYKSSYVPKQYGEVTLYTHARTSEALGYCPEDNCWGTVDYGSYPPEYEKIHVCGLGLFRDYYHYMGFGGYPNKFDVYRINYFKKEGIEWGEQIIVGLQERVSMDSKFYIYPNPATNLLTLEAGYPSCSTVLFLDITGKVVKAFEWTGSESQLSIDISALKPGMYFVRIIGEKSSFTQKLIKQH